MKKAKVREREWKRKRLEDLEKVRTTWEINEFQHIEVMRSAAKDLEAKRKPFYRV